MAKNYIEDHKVGTTWDGLKMVFEEEDEIQSNPNETSFTAVDLTGVSVLIQFKEKGSDTVIFEFKTEDNTVAIPNPVLGEIFMESRKMNVPKCEYAFTVKLIFPDGSIKEPIESFWNLY
jgi:hypothetical protein